MNRYKLLSQCITGGALATGIIASNYSKQKLSIYNFPEEVHFAISFVVLAVLIVVLKILFGHIIAAIPRLRKIFLGKQYVEGKWIDRLITNTGEECFGLITIEPNGETLTYGGENYTREGIPTGEFDSKMSDLDFPVITFKYSFSPSMREYCSEGILRITFHERPAVRFSAACMDYYKDNSESIEGWKITKKELLGKLKMPSGRSKVIKELIEAYYPIDAKTGEK